MASHKQHVFLSDANARSVLIHISLYVAKDAGYLHIPAPLDSSFGWSASYPSVSAP